MGTYVHASVVYGVVISSDEMRAAYGLPDYNDPSYDDFDWDEWEETDGEYAWEKKFSERYPSLEIVWAGDLEWEETTKILCVKGRGVRTSEEAEPFSLNELLKNLIAEERTQLNDAINELKLSGRPTWILKWTRA